MCEVTKRLLFSFQDRGLAMSIAFYWVGDRLQTFNINWIPQLREAVTLHCSSSAKYYSGISFQDCRGEIDIFTHPKSNQCKDKKEKFALNSLIYL